MSDSDDDLLALADIGSEPEETTTQPTSAEVINPYPLEGKYKDAEDRARLDALPEIEREEILYDRAQEMQRYEERRYLAQRRQQMTRLADHDESVPSAKRQRGTTGMTSGTKSGLAALKKKRQQQSARSRRRIDDGESSESEEEDSEASIEEDLDSEDEEIRKSFRRRRDEVEWADTREQDELADQSITLSDVNKIRWGKTLFSKFCMTPGFIEAVPGCFVRVNIGMNRSGIPVYRLCQIRKIVSHEPYQFLNQTVDQALVASMAGSERTLQFGICSDSPATPPEFEFWVNAMNEANLNIPSRRKAQLIFNEVRALSKRVLTSEEIDMMVRKRAELNGQRGANAVLAKAELLHQREIALDNNDLDLVNEIDEKLKLKKSNDQDVSANSSLLAKKSSHLEKLSRVNERNKRANVKSVRQAEVQAQTERRKAGNLQKADPFSRLRTTARVFYKSESDQKADESASNVSSAIQISTQNTVDTCLPLSAVDDLIARIDIKLDIDI